MIHYDSCPACGDSSIAFQLVAKDHTVSHQSFPIWECARCTLRFTQDVPDEAGIGDYYKSENYISHSDTKKGLINSLYHLVRKKTLVAKRKLIQKFTGKSNGSLLDIGAGTGAFAAHMKEGGWNVTAIEPDESARKAAAQLYKLDMKSSEELWNLPPASFDAITMWHVLEHVHELHRYLEQIKNMLRGNGRIFIAVPNYTCFDAMHYQADWAAYDVPRHLYHFSPASMERLLKTHGLKLQQIQPMWYDSFYVSMLSEQYRNGTGNHAAAFITGLRSNGKAMGRKENCSSVIYIVQKEN